MDETDLRLLLIICKVTVKWETDKACFLLIKTWKWHQKKIKYAPTILSSFDLSFTIDSSQSQSHDTIPLRAGSEGGIMQNWRWERCQAKLYGASDDNGDRQNYIRTRNYGGRQNCTHCMTGSRDGKPHLASRLFPTVQAIKRSRQVQ